MDKWVVEFGQTDELVARIYAGGDDAVKAICDYADECKAHCRSLVAFAKSCKTCWIPVTERLPEKGVPVIGWFPGATQSFECALNEHDGVWCEWGTGIYLYEDERPTHWMPFPGGPTDAK